LDQCGNYYHTDRTGYCSYGESADRERGATNADQSALLQSEPSVAFNVQGDLLFSIRVDDSIRYQKMDGFGASFTDSSAWFSMDEVDAKPAEYPDAESVHEFRSRT